MTTGSDKLGAGPAGDQDKCSYYRVLEERLFGVSRGKNCRKKNRYRGPDKFSRSSVRESRRMGLQRACRVKGQVLLLLFFETATWEMFS